MPYTPRSWIEFCCKQLAKGLETNESLREITDNSALIGAYAEASIREFIQRFVHPLKISTGAIVHDGNAGRGVPQLDTIVWHPSPLPPIIEAGDFAMVPRMSAVAYLEIKRSNYTNVGRKMTRTLDKVDDLVPAWEYDDPLLRLPGQTQPFRRAMGVICLHTASKTDKALAKLFDEGRSVAILSRPDTTARYSTHFEGVVALSRFLMEIRLRAKFTDGWMGINLPPSAP